MQRSYTLKAPQYGKSTLPATVTHVKAMASLLIDFNPEYVEKITTQDNCAFIRLMDGHKIEVDVQIMKIAFNTILELKKHLPLPPGCEEYIVEVLTEAKELFSTPIETWKAEEIVKLYRLIGLQADFMGCVTVAQWDRACVNLLNQQKKGRVGGKPTIVAKVEGTDAMKEVSRYLKGVKKKGAITPPEVH